MASDRGPTSADLTKLTTATNNSTRAMNALADGLRALNTNLVAIHELMKEKKIDE